MAINKETGFVNTRKSQDRTTVFEAKWGEKALDIAIREDVQVASIHMRVHNYGSPYQRRKAPNNCELIHGKTVQEIATELDIHPISVGLRLGQRGSAYVEHLVKDTGNPRNRVHAGQHWSTLRKYNSPHKGFWLMPEHPDYEKERSRCDNIDVAHQIYLAKAKQALQERNQQERQKIKG